MINWAEVREKFPVTKNRLSEHGCGRAAGRVDGEGRRD